MRRCIVFLSVFFVSNLHGQTVVLPGDFPDPSVTFSGTSQTAVFENFISKNNSRSGGPAPLFRLFFFRN